MAQHISPFLAPDQTLLPTTSLPSASASSALNPTPPLATRALLVRLSDSCRLALSQRKPWAELVDRNAFAKPQSLTDATGRIRKNWNYFRINYLLFVTAVIAFSLVSHPLSLFVLCTLLAAWIFLYFFRTAPLVLFGRSYSDREVLAIMSVLTIVVVFLTNVGSLLISAVVVGLGIASVHGAFRVPDDLFLDEPESGGGLLPFLGSAQPPIVTHV